MWKKLECRQRKIKESCPGKSRGQIEMAVGMFSIFMITLVMVAGLKVAQFMITGAYVEDALAASNLASALIDIEEFGRSRVIRINDPVKTYGIYKEALSQNLMLDEDGRSFQRELLEGYVEVISYIIYNVEGDQVQVISFNGGDVQPEVAFHDLGTVHTPDGVLVETATVYSKVRFNVKGLGQVYIQAEKEKSVDIKRETDYE